MEPSKRSPASGPTKDEGTHVAPVIRFPVGICLDTLAILSRSAITFDAKYLGRR